jgi:hypothetical protein
MNVYELQWDHEADVDIRALIEEAALTLGLVATQVTTLAKYPGCIHWHFKKGKQRGTLEATYWPDRNRAWLAYRPGREAPWIAPAIEEFNDFVQKRARAGAGGRLYPPGHLKIEQH